MVRTVADVAARARLALVLTLLGVASLLAAASLDPTATAQTVVVMTALSAATTLEVAAAATGPGRVDYLGIGVLRATATKADAPPPLGLAGFAELVAGSDLPAVAIGGILPADMHSLRRAGAAGAAIVSGICAALDPEEAARGYADAWAGGSSTNPDDGPPTL